MNTASIGGPKPERHELVTDGATLSMAQVAQLSGLSDPDVQGLLDYGVLKPVSSQGNPFVFNIGCVMTLQRADHLRQDLALDGHAFALAVMLLDQITGLENELHSLRPEARDHGAHGQPGHTRR